MADEPTNRELENLIKRNHADNRDDILDLKSQFAREVANLVAELKQYVLKEVYDAKELVRAALDQATHDRITRIEAAYEDQRREIAGHHRTNRLLFWTVVAGLLGAATTVVMTILFAKGGGHA